MASGLDLVHKEVKVWVFMMHILFPHWKDVPATSIFTSLLVVGLLAKAQGLFLCLIGKTPNLAAHCTSDTPQRCILNPWDCYLHPFLRQMFPCSLGAVWRQEEELL